MKQSRRGKAVQRTGAHAAHSKPYAVGVLLLTSATGSLDAVSFLALDQVFTGNMTGNILFLGFGLAGTKGVAVINNLVALTAFVVGAGFAAPATRVRSPNTTIPLSSVRILSVNGAVTACVAAAWLGLDVPTGAWVIAITGVLAYVLGAQAAAIAHIGIREYSTVVVTMTLVSFASDSRLLGEARTAQARRIAVLVAMTAGALVAAAILNAFGPAVALTLGTAQILAGSFALIVGRRREVIPATADAAP